jgi:hypothetical protein
MAERTGWMVQRCAVSALALCLFGLIGCASWQGPAVPVDTYHNTKLGYRVAKLDVVAPDWRAIGVDGADLAYRQSPPEGQRPALAALISECGRGSGNLSVVGRQLLIGIRNRALRLAAPVALRGSPGWMQIFDTIQDGEAIRVKTISIRDQGCTFDWVLVAPDSFSLAEDQFDGWWSSFVRDPPEPAGVEGATRIGRRFVRLALAQEEP